jgi:hypothetical protein
MIIPYYGFNLYFLHDYETVRDDHKGGRSKITPEPLTHHPLKAWWVFSSAPGLVLFQWLCHKTPD